MSKNRAIVLIIILSIFIFFIGGVHYNLIRPTKINKIIASKYKKPANKHFLDQNFYNCVIEEYNKENNASFPYTANLTDEQLGSIKSVSCTNENVSSVNGIQYLTNLEILNLYKNLLTSLDVSTNTKLEKLSVDHNQLTSLDIGNNVNLKSLMVSNNQLTNLNVRNNEKLEYLYANNNNLKELDVSNNAILRYLYAYVNKLTSLDVSNNVNLESLYVYENKLTSLDVSNNANLESLWISNNQLANLDVSNNTKLMELEVRSNQLTSLDVSNNVNLESLYVYENKLTSLDVSNNANLKSLDVSRNQLTSLDVSYNVNLESLYVYENKLTSLDVSNNANLESLWISNNQLANLDVSNNANLKSLDVSRNQLTSLDVSNNASLKNLDVLNNQLTSLDVSNNTKLMELVVSGNQLTSLDTGNNINLTILNASNNQLTSLDISDNTKLMELVVSGNQLTSLDTGNNIDLTILNASNNQLTKIDVSTNTKLEKLSVDYNQLTSLDTGNNINLLILNASNNKLTKIDLSNNTKLGKLYVDYNQLTSLDTDNNINLLILNASNNKLTKIDVSKNTKLYNLNVSNNQLTNLNVRNNEKLEYLYANHNNLKELDISNNILLKKIDINNNYIISLDTSNNPSLEKDIIIPYPKNKKFSDGIFYYCVVAAYNNENNTSFPYTTNLTDEQLSSIKSVFCKDKEIFSLEGIQYLTNLTDLDVSNNQLTSLDIGNNAILRYLYAYENKLTSLDVSNNMNLEILYAYENKLTNLDVSNNANLESLWISNNQLTSLDISNNSKLNKLKTKENQFYLGESTIYEETNIDLLSLLDNSNYKLNNKFKIQYKYSEINNSVTTDTNIAINKTGKYQIKLYFNVFRQKTEEIIDTGNDSFATENNKEDVEANYGVYNINAILQKLSSTKYKVNNEKNYVYTALDNNPETIISNLKIEGPEGTLNIKDDKIQIICDGEVVREYKLLCIKNSKYDLSKNYIYTSFSKFNMDYIETSPGLDKSIVNDVFELKYDGEVFDSYNLLYLTTSYEHWQKNIFVEGNFNEDNIVLNNSSIASIYLENIYEQNENGENVLIGKNICVRIGEEIDKYYILYINFGDLNVHDNKIIVYDNMNYEDFMSKIKETNMDVKLYKDEKQVTAGKIEGGMTLKVSKNEFTKIYTITDEYCNLDKLEIDEKNLIKNIKIGETYKSIKEKIDTSGSIKFIDKNGKELNETDKVRTGSKLKIELKSMEKEYTFVIKGDVTGTGTITIGDVIKVSDYLLNNNILKEDCYKEAADVTNDGNIRINDVIKLSDYLLGGSL